MAINRLLFISVFAFFANSVLANTITVEGKDDIDWDRPNIQKEINMASPGDLIKLVGTFQLDGHQILIQKSNLTIAGAGAAGNWSTILKGLTDNGAPIPDYPDGTFFNRGLSIGPTDGVISNVSIQGIKFTGLNRAISVSPSVDSNSTDCETTTITEGTAREININNNWFDNDVRGVQALGASNRVSIKNNLLTNILNRGIVVVGTITTCTPFPPGFLLIGLPTFTDISGNTIQNDSSEEAIIVLAADNLTVSRNTVTNSNNFIPIVVQGITNSTLSNNILEGGVDTFAGIFAETIIAADPSWPIQIEPIKNSKIINNQIKNSLIGIIVDNDVSDLSVINNQFSNSGIVDIWLRDSTVDDANFCDFYFPDFGPTPPSSNNKVITTNYSNTVIDNGVNNQLSGTQKLLNNPNVPPAVKDRLKNNAIGRPPLN